MKRQKKFDSENGFEAWGDYMGAKISKLEEQFRHSAANAEEKLTDLFAGISIFVNGYTNPSSDELKRLMIQHGGVYHHYKRPTTTYTIASNLPDVKVKSITSEIIISPQWVVDCIEKMSIVDYTKYLLYSNHKPSQPKLMFGRVVKTGDVKKSNEQNDISKVEVLSLMSKLTVLNEKFKGSDFNDNTTCEQDSISQKPINDAVENKSFSAQASTSTSALSESNIVTDHAIEDKARIVEAHIAKIEPTSDPKKPTRASLTATDPNFLQEFFNNSRLHHIATLGAGFKQHVSELREKHDGFFPERDILRQKVSNSGEFGTEGPFIMHIDMDCFFVSVGLRKNPHLRGHPVAVTHSKGSEGGKMQSRPGQDRTKEIELYQKRLEERFKTPDIPYESRLLNIDDNNSMSEIASCSYEARKLGVKNGMFVGSALKLCPNLKTIQYDFDGYREVAFTLYNTIAKYTLNIEAVSCDEMFVDLTELINNTSVNVMDFVSYVRAEIKDITGCPCSAGVGANRLQARMATKKAKPDGQYYLTPDHVEEYMRNIPIADLPGIGPSTTYRLKQLSWNTCGDLQRISGTILQREFGKKFGETIYQACRGIDNRPLVYENIRKSVSVDVNYGIRFKDDAEVKRFMKQLSEEIHKRLNEIKKRGKLITVKLLVRSPEAPVETAKYMGHGLCDIITKSAPLKEYTCDLNVIENTVHSLMSQIAAPPHELRGIGLQISKFEDSKNHVETKNSLKMMFQRAEAKIESSKTAQENKGTSIVSTSETSPVKPSVSKLEVTPTKILSIEPPIAPSRDVSSKKSDSKYKNSAQKVGKSRGRPPKCQVTNKLKQSNDMLRFLKEPKIESQQEIIPEGIDPKVLAELPDDIRAEVLKDYKFRAKPSVASDKKSNLLPQEQSVASSSSSSESISNPEKITVDLKFLQALPAELRLEVEKQIELNKDTMMVTSSEPEFSEHLQVTPETSPIKDALKVSPAVPETEMVSEPENVLLQTDWRKTLQAWVDSSEEPEQVDVDIIATCASELVEGKYLSELHLALRYLFRIIEERKLCSWHRAYFRIVNSTQASMKKLYRGELNVQGDFGCVNKKCSDLN
ncbi:DNA repair protein Rev1 [Sabethes cyaneus]|uniref:DNA repair protein Rev1 n=1 Tax=Sabethes cyaneus TaxID=53552 RepID=UPI00237D8266|nr:DNA repair protein Rev1 [Sabethes cyaneus]